MSCLGSGEFPVPRGTFYLPLFSNRTVVGAGETGWGGVTPSHDSTGKGAFFRCWEHESLIRNT